MVTTGAWLYPQSLDGWCMPLEPRAKEEVTSTHPGRTWTCDFWPRPPAQSVKHRAFEQVGLPKAGASRKLQKMPLAVPEPSHASGTGGTYTFWGARVSPVRPTIPQQGLKQDNGLVGVTQPKDGRIRSGPHHTRSPAGS